MKDEKKVKEIDVEELYPKGEVIDISSEAYRLYRYDKGETTIIHDPKTLFVYANNDHKVVDKKKNIHIVKKGWKHLKLNYNKETKNPELLLEGKRNG